MTKKRWMGGTVLGWLLLAPGLWSQAAALDILSPPDQVSVAGDSVVLIGVGASSASVAWVSEGASGHRQGSLNSRISGAFTGTVQLVPGLNQIRVGEQRIQVFSGQGGLAAPRGFRPLRVHAGDIANCTDCHTADLKVRGGGYPEVCLNCHVVEAENPAFTGAVTDDRHFASATTKCGRCHDPHGSADAKLLVGDSQSLCGQCHGQWKGGSEVHAAYDEGGCVACHAPHFSGYPKQLASTVAGVCQACHEQGAGGSAHVPVTNAAGCGNCHDVHGAGTTMTPVGSPGLCLRCHGEVTKQGHGEELEDCATCHDPHGSGGMVRGTVAAACTECHEGVAEEKTVHAALDKGCQGCHSPHRDDNLANARAGCAACHDVDDNRELASLHGGLQLAPGSCGGCHPAHEAPLDKLLLGRPHFPLSQGKCGACHVAGDESLRAVDANRCRTCHGFDRELAATDAGLHDPVSEGECLTCHRPHLGGAGLLRATQTVLCGECHQVLTGGAGRTAHSAAESCTDCHAPHGGGEAHFLTVAGDALCLECHDDPTAAGGTVHEALAEGCQSCHSPHSGYAPGVLIQTQRELCLECHDDPTDSGPHRKVPAELVCSTCHDPHSSRHRALLRSDDCAVGGDGQRGDGTSVQ